MTLSTENGGAIVGPSDFTGGSMFIKLNTSTIVGGKGYKAGAVVDASEKDATYLINTGAAVKTAEPKKPKAKAKAKAKKPDNRAIDAGELDQR